MTYYLTAFVDVVGAVAVPVADVGVNARRERKARLSGFDRGYVIVIQDARGGRVGARVSAVVVVPAGVLVGADAGTLAAVTSVVT